MIDLEAGVSEGVGEKRSGLVLLLSYFLFLISYFFFFFVLFSFLIDECICGGTCDGWLDECPSCPRHTHADVVHAHVCISISFSSSFFSRFHPYHVFLLFYYSLILL